MHRRRHFAFSASIVLMIIASVLSSPNADEKIENKKDEAREIDPNVAQDRSLHVGPHNQHSSVSRKGYQDNHGGGGPYPIPVPLPLPVHPGSIVLPSLPLGSQGKGGSSAYDKSSFNVAESNVQHEVAHAENHPGARFHGGGGQFHSQKAPPAIVHKQPRAPLTRSSNPSPVSQFIPDDKDTIGYKAPPPPPPPQLPVENYAQPTHNHHSVASHGSHNRGDFSPPSNDLRPDGYEGVESGQIQTYNVPPPAFGPTGYSAPKQSDIYEGRNPILNHGSSLPIESYEPVPQHIDDVHGNNFQALPQVGIPPTGYSGHDSDISGSAYVPPNQLGGDEPWPLGNVDMPQIANLNVKCDKNLMRVTIEFDRPFYGIIFSKGHYSNVHCVHLPAGLGKLSATFDISINSCGTVGNSDNGGYGYGSQTGAGTFFENTLIIQYDPQVQEVWDQARKLRCTWHDQYEKYVTFKPFPVGMLDVVRADFAGDNVGCWMQIQVGKGPWASEVSGLVKIGQTMTMVLAIKDDDNKFDMLVRNCMAHDGKRAPIQLVDQRGCVTRPKLMSRFTKIKNFGASASVLSYAHFQAFKFPDSMEVHFQCTIQICRYQCPEQCADAGGVPQQVGVAYDVPASVGHPSDNYRRKRDTNQTSDDGEKDIGVNRIIQVVSTRDLSFMIDKNEIVKEMKETDRETLIASVDETLGFICMSTPGFAATLVVLLSILIISCLLSAFLCMRFRGPADTQSIISSYQNPAFLHKKRFF